MKTRIMISLTFLLWVVSVPSFSQDEKAVIKAVIEKEATAYFGVDQKNWEGTWLDAPYTFWSYSDSTGGSFVEGTQNIKKNFEEYFRTAKPSVSRIDRVWMEFRMYGKGAYVRFVQKITDEIDHDETSEVRVLEKDKSGKWKIVFLSASAKYPSN
jgi:hypothetical protein